MRVLGIDCGAKSTGYGIIESQGSRSLRLITSGVITTSARDPFPRRLSRIYEGLKTIIEEYSPEEVAIEDLFYARNFRTAVKLGHVRAVAMLAADGVGLPVAEYSPLEVKSSMVGYGRAEKSQVQEMVKRVFSLAEAPQSHDAADALAVALCHLHTLTTKIKMGIAQPGSNGKPHKRKANRNRGQ